MDTWAIFRLNLRPHFKTVFPKYFKFFSTINSKMPKNMCKLRHKVHNGHFYPHESQNFKHFTIFFSNLNFYLNFRLSKTYSINMSFKNPAYGRQSISRPMRIVAPCHRRLDQEYPKTQFFWKTEKNIQNAKTQKRLEICQN